MSNIKCDKNTCIGCLACVYTCKDAHSDGDYSKAVSRRSYSKVPIKDTDLEKYLTKSCMHCKKAKCIDACPAGIITRDEYDFVQITNIDKCFGCKHCAIACPFDAITFAHTDTCAIVMDGLPFKCDGCVDRLKEGLEPACVEICPVKALTYVSTVN